MSTCAACWAQIEVWASSEEDFRAWDGWVHSRLRQLVLRVELFVLVRPWPKARFLLVVACSERGLSTTGCMWLIPTNLHSLAPGSLAACAGGGV